MNKKYPRHINWVKYLVAKEMLLEMVDTHEHTETAQALWVIRGSSFLTEAGGPDQRYQANHYETTFAVVQCFPLITYLRALNVTKVSASFTFQMS